MLCCLKGISQSVHFSISQSVSLFFNQSVFQSVFQSVSHKKLEILIVEGSEDLSGHNYAKPMLESCHIVGFWSDIVGEQTPNLYDL